MFNEWIVKMLNELIVIVVDDAYLFFFEFSLRWTKINGRMIVRCTKNLIGILKMKNNVV